MQKVVLSIYKSLKVLKMEVFKTYRFIQSAIQSTRNQAFNKHNNEQNQQQNN